MMEPHSAGKSIRLFLVDGSPLGIIVGEIVNWTGAIVAFPRGLLKQVLERKQITKTGVYFLVGDDPDQPGQQIVYVGKSDNVAERLKQHGSDAKKELLDRVAVFVSKDDNLTVGHAGYLENRLITIVQKTGSVKVHNDNNGSAVNLPESDRSDMEQVVQHLRILMPVLGFTFLQEAPKRPVPVDDQNSNVTPQFELTALNGSVHAEAYELEGRMVVRAGSTARHPSKAAQSASKGYFKQINQLMQQNKLVQNIGSEELLKFAEDVAFGSPSAASDIVMGSSTNGREMWKIKTTGQSYGDWWSNQLTDAEHNGLV
jgi:hypothetical protein